MLRKTKADIGKSPHQLFVLVCVSEIVAAVYQIIICYFTAHEHSYEEYNGSWYYYAKATNEVGTRYVSTPNIIIDADPAVALEYPSGKELTGK